MKTFLGFIFYFLVITTYSQIVETVATNPTIVDGLHVDEAGLVFTTPGGLMGGTGIGVYNPGTDAYTANFVTGIFGGIDIDQFNDSMLAVTAYDNNSLYEVNKNTGQVEQLATGFDGPSGIAVDQENTIYVANYGSPPTYNGNTIHKVLATGEKWVYIESELLFQVQAMAFNPEGELVVYSQNMLYKVNPSDSSLVEWTAIENKLNNMVYREEDQSFYATSITSHLIYKITDQGEVSVFSGSSLGYADGAFNEALFTRPLGIGITEGGESLYISESGPGRLRRVIMNSQLNTERQPAEDFVVFPNPVGDYLEIKGSAVINEWSIFDSAGVMRSKGRPNSSEFRINLDSLPSGKYVIELGAETQLIRKSFIKN